MLLKGFFILLSVGNLLTAASANIGQFVEGKYELALDSKRNGFVEHLQVLGQKLLF